MHSECNDIRLYAGEEKQKHWVADNTCNTDSTDIWIKIDELVPEIINRLFVMEIQR